MPIDQPLRSAITATLARAGPTGAPDVDELVPHIYHELQQMARRQLGREMQQNTLQTTELVHEAYLRLVDDDRVTSRGRAYFFASAARAMRQVLVEAARRRGAAKRGGGAVHVTLGAEGHAVSALAAELLDLELALQDLERLNPRQARVVECRYFGGLNVEETASALQISPRTVKSDWALARAWLYAELRPISPQHPS